VRVYTREFRVETRSQYELVDVTNLVEEAVRDSGVKNGVALVYAPHATAAIVVNENESGLKRDILEWIKDAIPRDGRWLHNRIDDNAAAHIGSALIGSSRVFPVVDGRLYRGTWQNIFLLEMDGPRASRRILVTVIGE